MKPLSEWTDDDIEMWQHDGTYLGFTMAEYVAEIRRREREKTKEWVALEFDELARQYAETYWKDAASIIRGLK